MYRNKEIEFRNQIKRCVPRMREETLLRLFCSLADEVSTNFVYLYAEELKALYSEIVKRGLDHKIPERKFAVDFCKEIYKVNKF